MKKLLLALVTALSFSASANDDPILVDLPIVCIGLKTLSEVLDEFGETAAMTMQSVREIEGVDRKFATVLFINYETKTWTLAERINSNRFCVVAVGEAIAPYIKK